MLAAFFWFQGSCVIKGRACRDGRICLSKRGIFMSAELAVSALSMVLPVLVMVCIGRFLAKNKIISKDGIEGIRTVIGEVTLPVVLFNAFFTAEYNRRMLLVFVMVYAGFCIALLFGYATRRFVKPYGRFMPFLLTGAEGGMLGYSLFALLAGAERTSVFAIVDIGQTVFAYTVYLSCLRIADGQKASAGAVFHDVITNKACLGMLSGIVLGAAGVGKAVLSSAAAPVVTELIGFITAPTAALILIIVGYEFELSGELIRPVAKTVVLRLSIMAVLFAAVGTALTVLTGFDRELLMALALIYSLPAPFIIPLFADVEEDGAYISTTLSVQTLVMILLFIPLAVISRM